MGTPFWHWQWVHPSLATWPNSVGDHFGNQSKSEFSICCWAAYPNKQDEIESCIRFWKFINTLHFSINFSHWWCKCLIMRNSFSIQTTYWSPLSMVIFQWEKIGKCLVKHRTYFKLIFPTRTTKKTLISK